MAIQKASSRKKRGKTSIRQKQKVTKQKGRQNQLVNVKVAAPKTAVGKQPQVIYGPGGAGAASSSSSSSSGGGPGGTIPVPYAYAPAVATPAPGPAAAPPVTRPPVQPPSPYLRPGDCSADQDSFMGGSTTFEQANPMRPPLPSAPGAVVEVDLSDVYPERPKRPYLSLPQQPQWFQGYPGLGPHGRDDFGGGPPDPDAGAAAIMARIDPYVSDAMRGMEQMQAEARDLMRRSEEARLAQEVQHRQFMDDQARLLGEERSKQQAALRADMESQLRRFADQARGLFNTLEAQLQRDMQLTSDRRLEAEKEALRQEYNALLEAADRYRRDKPDSHDGGAALLVQIQRANTSLRAMEDRISGFMSREDVLAEMRKERDDLAKVQAVRAELRGVEQQRALEVRALQDNIRGLREVIQQTGQSVPKDLQETLERLSREVRRNETNVGTVTRDIERLRGQLQEIPQDVDQRLGAAVERMRGSLESFERETQHKLAASDERLTKIAGDQINARRLGERVEGELRQLQGQLRQQADDQARQLAVQVGDLREGLRSTNASGEALAQQVARVREQLETTVTRQETNQQLSELASAVDQGLANVQREIESEQDRRVRRQLEPYRGAVRVLSAGARMQAQATGEILQRMQEAQAVRQLQAMYEAQQAELQAQQAQMDVGQSPAARGMMSLGGTGLTDLAQAGGAQGLMAMRQGGGEAAPRTSTLQDFMSILGAREPPVVPTAELRTTVPDVMPAGQDLDASGTSSMGELTWDPSILDAFGGDELLGGLTQQRPTQRVDDMFPVGEANAMLDQERPRPARIFFP
jgi:hypothetical protein